MGKELKREIAKHGGRPLNDEDMTEAEVARARGVESYLIDSPDDIDPAWLVGKRCVGISSGASAPEDVVQAVLVWLRKAGVSHVEEIEAPDEKVVFTVPKLSS